MEERFNIKIIAKLCSKKEVVFDCPICIETICGDKRLTNSCGHEVCDSCMMKYLKTQYENGGHPCCSICRHPLFVLETSNEDMYTEFSQYINLIQENYKPVSLKKRMHWMLNYRNLNPINNNNHRIYPGEEEAIDNESYDSGSFVVRRHRRIYTI